MDSSKSINYEIIENLFESSIHYYGLELRKLYDVSDIYVSGIYINEEFTYISSTFNMVSEFANQNWSLLKKWSPPDWIYHTKLDYCFESVMDELRKIWTDDYSDFEIDTQRLEKMYLKYLKIFKDKYMPEDTLIGIFSGDMGLKIVKNSIVNLNSEKLVTKFLNDTAK